ncbi:MAG: hypothetical protein IJD32_08245 [Bacteroidaceae bacterium]|nr:hypothetical protein [Bacteroidaceae bacterium]
MKKNIRAVMMIAAVALIAGVNVFNSQRAIAMSDIALANVEALADDETGDTSCRMNTKTWICDHTGDSSHCYCGI